MDICDALIASVCLHVEVWVGELKIEPVKVKQASRAQMSCKNSWGYNKKGQRY